MALNYVVLDLDNGETMTSSHFIACLKMIAECNVAGRKDEGMPSIIFTKCDKESIKRNLIRVSDNNEYNIIIVCSDKTLNNIKEAIKEIVDNSISNKLNELISRLQGEPPFTHFKDFICGIRKRTFIFSACSNSNNVHHIVYCKYKILQIMNWIYKQEEATMIEAKDNKSNISSADASIHTCAPSCSKFVEETERTSMEIEIPKKLRSSIMFSVDIALNIMRNVIREDEVRTADVKLSDSHCRILAEDLYSSTNVPSRRTSAKYGYAVLASDGKGVRKVLPSSSPETSVLTPGTCMRIRSGAPIPVGATAVVKLENTRVTEKYKNNDHSDYFNRDNKEYEIEVLTVPEINENIRDAGYHIKSNQLVLEKYSYIGPIEMGILDLCNFKTLPMTAELLVGLLSIGDELNELEKLYESSSKIILRSLLEKNYYVTDYKISSYELEVMVEKLQKALKKMNVIVIIGRVNDKEMLKTILKGHFEATIHFGRVNMKPGKSTTFATCMLEGEKKYILCMSSNPATVPVVAQVFLLPLLKELHCNFEEPISIETRINSQHELHSRPTFSWATLHQTATGFSKAYCSESQNQNVMRVAKKNVLLTLPPRTLRKPMLNDGTLVQATVSGLK